MKKLFITLMVMFGVAAGVSAQEVGRVWVGGTFAAYRAESKIKTSTEKKENGFNFKIMPEIGYTLTENVGLGISLGYGQDKIDAGRDSETGLSVNGKVDFQTFTVAPFVRYTYLRSGIVGLFVDGTIGYTYGKDKSKNKLGEKTDVKYNSYEAGFRPGVSLNASSRVAFIAKVGFLGYQYTKAGDNNKYNKYGLDLDLSNVQFGVNVYF